jgi:hypothetical protein
VVAHEPGDPLTEQRSDERGAVAGVGAGTTRSEGRGDVVDQACDLELGVAGRGVGQDRRALQVMGERIDRFTVRLARTGGERGHQLVDGAERGGHEAEGFR